MQMVLEFQKKIVELEIEKRGPRDYGGQQDQVNAIRYRHFILHSIEDRVYLSSRYVMILHWSRSSQLHFVPVKSEARPMVLFHHDVNRTSNSCQHKTICTWIHSALARVLFPRAIDSLIPSSGEARVVTVPPSQRCVLRPFEVL